MSNFASPSQHRGNEGIKKNPAVASLSKAGPKVFRYPSQSNLSWDSQKKAIQENKSSEDIMLATDQSLLWKMMSTYIENDLATVQRQITDHVEYTLACDRSNFSKYNAYQATAYSARDRLIEFYQDSNFRFAEANTKRVYYLSIEYLLGRSLGNALLNLGVEGTYAKALKQFGFALEDLADQEVDAGLGNGGLGRLAACFWTPWPPRTTPLGDMESDTPTECSDNRSSKDGKQRSLISG